MNGPGWEVMAGWAATEDDVEECQHRMCDLLVESMGDRRTGDVVLWAATDDVARAQLDSLRSHEPETMLAELADSYRRIAGLLREYGGWLVLAGAPNRDAIPAA